MNLCVRMVFSFLLAFLLFPPPCVCVCGLILLERHPSDHVEHAALQAAGGEGCMHGFMTLLG